jgi:hypothetical protein
VRETFFLCEKGGDLAVMSGCQQENKDSQLQIPLVKCIDWDHLYLDNIARTASFLLFFVSFEEVARRVGIRIEHLIINASKISLFKTRNTFIKKTIYREAP